MLQLLKLPDGTVKVLVEGGQRARIAGFTETRGLLPGASPSRCRDEPGEQKELEALARTVVSQFEQYIKLNKKIPPEVLVSINQIEDPGKLADTVAAHLTLKIAEKQELLETQTVAERLEKVFGHMEGEIGVLQVEKRIRNRVKRQMEKTQREYYLNEQLKAIQKELGEGEDGRDEIAELEDQINKTKLSKEARDKAHGGAEEAAHHEPDVGRGDGRAQLPRLAAVDPVEEAHQDQATTSTSAEKVLDDDHYGLEKVKERILEYLAVQQRMHEDEGPDPVPGRPARRRQDLARQVDRAGHRPQLRAHVAGRRARRGRDPRPPADLYRLDARQGHPGHEEGEVRRTRCSCSTRSTSSAPTGAAIRPRRCSRCWTRSRTRPSTTITSRSTTTCRT